MNDAYGVKKKYRRRRVEREAHSNLKSSEKKNESESSRIIGLHTDVIFIFCLFLMTPASTVCLSLSLQLADSCIILN